MSNESWSDSCYDITNVMSLNMLYHLPNSSREGCALEGHQRLVVRQHRSDPGRRAVHADHQQRPFVQRRDHAVQHHARQQSNTVAQTVTFACTGQGVAFIGAPACTGATPDRADTYTVNFIPFNKNTVITGNPNQWFNPLMFGDPPLGQLGNAPRNFLRQPGLANWNLSLVKDTKVGWLGEAGNVQFRAEVFNVTNTRQLPDARNQQPRPPAFSPE